MNIAIVGGGERCRLLLRTILKYSFEKLDPKVVIVADESLDAPGVKEAMAQGIEVTTDYNDLFNRDDIDLIIELTGKQDVFHDILKKKKSTVRAFNHETAELFWELSRISALHESAQEELNKTKTLYNVFINELMEEDVMIITPDYRIRDTNETLAKKIGLGREELTGRFCYEISHHQNVPCEGKDHPCPLIKTIESRGSSQTTHIHRDSKGNILYYSISCYPIFENDEIVAVVEISRDITKEILMQKTMMEQEKLASIGRLAAGVAHEINNPMTTILTTAMLIQEDLDAEDPIYQELQTITNETLRCRKIVKSLLDFARQAHPLKKYYDINKLVTESVALTRKQASFQDVELKYELGDNVPNVYADKDHIQQALINLILNAIEATDAGGRVTVTTRLAVSGDRVEILVSDTGKGIPEEDLEKIFEPFFTTKETGTGLGMAITHGLIEQHGGNITVRSKVGQGTTFTVSLPLENNDA